jgi:hypothetical protein
MLTSLCTMLILTACGQDDGAERQPPELHRVRNDITLVTYQLGGDPQPITLEMPGQPAAADIEGAPQPVRPPRGFNIRRMVLVRENFDRWLFADGGYHTAHQRYLDDLLRAKVETAARKHGLTELQRAKLQLAGRGDIKRFFDEVQEKRQRFEEDRQDFNAGLAALRRLDPLTRVYQEGPFGDGSLFAKTLRKIKEEKKVDRQRATGDS